MTLHVLSRAPSSPDDPILDVPRLMAPWGPQTLVVLDKADVSVLQTYLPRAQWQVFPLDKTYRKWQALLWRIVSPLPHVARLHLAEEVSQWLLLFISGNPSATVVFHGPGSLVYADVLRHTAPQTVRVFLPDLDVALARQWVSAQSWVQDQLARLSGLLGAAVPGVPIPHADLPGLVWPLALPSEAPPVVQSTSLDLLTVDSFIPAEAQTVEVLLLREGVPATWVWQAVQLGRPLVAEATHPLANPDYMLVLPAWTDEAVAAAIADLQANPGKRSLLAAAARDFYWSTLSPQAVGQRLRTFLDELRAAKATHRADQSVTS